MPNPEAETFDEYLAIVPPERVDGTRVVLELMRSLLPGADERVQWGIAIFSRRGCDIAGIAARKGSFSLYVPNATIHDRYVPRLGDVDAGKGCIRYRHPDDIDTGELRAMISELAASIDQ